MTACFIKTRKGPKGKRFLVYFRRGGRDFPEEYAGSFKTMKEAKTRHDLIAGEMAAGRDPRVLLEEIKNPPPPPPSLDDIWGMCIAGRIDVKSKTIKTAELSRGHWTRILGADRDPQSITPTHIVAGIAELLAMPLAPDTVRQYLSGLSQVLDYADVYPNPASSPKVKLPKRAKAEITPPSTAEWFAVREMLRERSVLPLELSECCALRIGESTDLLDGDFDWRHERIRVSADRTKTAAGQRWLPVPRRLLDKVADRRPIEDRATDRRTFEDVRADQVRKDLAEACILAGVPSFSPHQLRHRRISLWYRQRIDPITVSGWAGHANPAMGLTTYGHVMIDHRDDEWRSFWHDVYNADRGDDTAHVRHGDAADG